MPNVRLCTVALAGLFSASIVQAQYAISVTAFNQGDTNDLVSGYNDPTVALGSPTTDISYQNSDPFNPPFLSSDIVGIGSGGSLTVQFANSILKDLAHPYGIDFIIFGHAGFEAINYNDPPSDWITDGGFFTGGVGTTRVSVSADGVHFFTLDPLRAPNADDLLPTDSAGDFLKAANPALTASDFNGKDLAGIRSLYDGSGGGTGYDLSWAQDSGGNSVSLSSVNYVKVDVLSGTVYLDAFSVVPEPSAFALAALGTLGWLITRRGQRRGTNVSDESESRTAEAGR